MKKQSQNAVSLDAKAVGDLRQAREVFDKTADDLRRLADIVKLASFAAEARRVLSAIDGASGDEGSTLHKEIAKWVSQSGQWNELEDTTSLVLTDVGDQLEALAEMADRAYIYFPPLPQEDA